MPNKDNMSLDNKSNKRKPFGWLDKVNNLATKTIDRKKEFEKAKSQYDKDLSKWKAEQEKIKLENANAADKMKANWQKYKENAIKSFAGNYNKSITTPGQELPFIPKKPEEQFNPMQGEALGPKIASVLSSRGSAHIDSMIKHAYQMRKLNNLIKYIEYGKRD